MWIFKSSNRLKIRPNGTSIKISHYKWIGSRSVCFFSTLISICVRWKFSRYSSFFFLLVHLGWSFHLWMSLNHQILNAYTAMHIKWSVCKLNEIPFSMLLSYFHFASAIWIMASFFLLIFFLNKTLFNPFMGPKSRRSLWHCAIALHSIVWNGVNLKAGVDYIPNST